MTEGGIPQKAQIVAAGVATTWSPWSEAGGRCFGPREPGHKCSDGQAGPDQAAESMLWEPLPREPGQGGWLPDGRADESAPEIIRP